MTSATRLARLRAAKRAQGLKRLTDIWAHPDDEADVKAYAAELAQARQAPSSSDSDGRSGGKTRTG